MAGLVRLVVLAALPAALGSCSPDPLPGTQLGTFKVTGNSTTNTCGLGAPDPWTFYVALSRVGSTLYWSYQDGSPILTGAIDAQSNVTLRNTNTENVDGTDAGLGPCTMERDDDVILTVPASPGTSWTGTVAYSFSVPSGSDCSDQLAAGGGQFQALPCSVSYDVSASPH